MQSERKRERSSNSAVQNAKVESRVTARRGCEGNATNGRSEGARRSDEKRKIAAGRKRQGKKVVSSRWWCAAGFLRRKILREPRAKRKRDPRQMGERRAATERERGACAIAEETKDEEETILLSLGQVSWPVGRWNPVAGDFSSPRLLTVYSACRVRVCTRV